MQASLRSFGGASGSSPFILYIDTHILNYGLARLDSIRQESLHSIRLLFLGILPLLLEKCLQEVHDSVGLYKPRCLQHSNLQSLFLLDEVVELY